MPVVAPSPLRIDTAIALLADAASRSAQGRLQGKVLGLVGYGRVGREIGRRAVRCGMEVLYADIAPSAGPHRRVLLGELLARSDFVLLLRTAAELPRDADMQPHLKPGAQLLRIAMPPEA